jgi:hypothetical protein
MNQNKISSIIIFLLTLINTNVFAQKATIWATYGHSKFMLSPGIEANYMLNNKIGLQMGAGSYIQVLNTNKISSTTADDVFNLYNANLGICTYVYKKNDERIGFTSGLKVYYGPDYKPLQYYKEEGYYIYYDSSLFKIDYGLDFGIFYVKDKLSFLLKFDTARNKFRIGLGYSFSKTKQ